MPAQVAIIHGWSDTSKSFRSLRDFLVANGYEVTQIWLGDYVSMDDDVRIQDVGKRMQAVVSKAIADGDLAVPFDLIIHSTGGLVAREWVTRFYPDGTGCPAKRIIMLAPANFGSRLASLGKSMIGRVAKGWNNWFQTGKEVLAELELASRYQWNLSRSDLLDPEGDAGGPYGAGKIWPFVITGTRAYPSGLRQIVNEDGSDGTVRVAAANLNAAGLTVDFSTQSEDPQVRPWRWRAKEARFPFAVLPDRDHSTIIRPDAGTAPPTDFSTTLGRLILEALHCPSDEEYAQVYDRWSELTEQTAALAEDDQRREATFGREAPAPGAFHQYMQIVTLVRDDHGEPIDDYFLEFFAPEARGNADVILFHSEVLEHVHVNGAEPSLRCLLVDHTDLLQRYYPTIRDRGKRQVAVSLSAAALGRNIRYFDSTREGARGHLVVHEEDEERRADLKAARLHRNTTHLVEIIIPRQPLDRVFTLSQ